jgi:multiple sugar transport system permease protein
MSTNKSPVTDDRWGNIAHPKRVDPLIVTIGGPILRYALLILLAIIFLFPFYLIVRGALSTQAEMSSFDWVWWPENPQWSNWNTLFDDGKANMARGLQVSAALAIINLVFQTLFASMAGYALARIPVRGSGAVFAVILLTLMVPAAVTFVPTYVVLAKLNGIDTLWGIVVPGLFSAFATFLFRQFYLDFPRELEEAGRLDGLSYLGVYFRLLIPNSLGIMAALGVIGFIGSWNSFLWPSIVSQSSDTRTVQVVLSTFLTAQTINLPALFMGAAVGAAPLVIVFLVMQRWIVEGVRMSGIKG